MKVFITFLLIVSLNFSQKSKSIKQFVGKTKLTKGFYGYYFKTETNEIFLEVSSFGNDFLYVNSLSAGVGSNDIGLDRGQLGSEHVVQFQRYGNKVLLVQKNLDFRAITSNQAEKSSVDDAFASSTIAGFKVVAETKNTVLINLTDFLLQDSHGISSKLKQQNQGNFKADKSRSAIYPNRTKNFPKNTEFESLLTLTGSAKGSHLRSVLPNNSALTVRTHHSFIKLPDSNYKPRVNDSRSGYFGIDYQDYSTPIHIDMNKSFIARHRLEKKNPEAKISEAKEPIIYYLDPGTPEPIRSALLDGARWWNQAFEAIGYKDAFQVKMLPENADPMDVRYNVIQWVHRSTRGWSYGVSITDPRTGEILKGNVSLGSLRVRQDFLIAEGLLSPYKNKGEVPKEMQEMALARIRQLSAHEIGHTLGIAHNFATSGNNRASVMDYPHPLVTLKNDKIDIKNAYAANIGEWDKIVIAYGYSDFPNDKNESVYLADILEKYQKDGFEYISDSDSRSPASIHPNAHLWDNGENASDELNRVLKVRNHALNNFNINAIPYGDSYKKLEDALVPIYLFHRYQVEAAVKLISGMKYRFAVRDDMDYTNKIVSSEKQKNAISAILNTIDANALALPRHILNIIVPDIYKHRELFNGRTTFGIDPIAIAESSARFSIDLLLNSSRVNRLLEFHSRDSSLPSVSLLIEMLLNKSIKQIHTNPYIQEIQNGINSQVIQSIFSLYLSKNTSFQTKAIINLKLSDLLDYLEDEINDTDNYSKKAHYIQLTNEINLFKTTPEKYKIKTTSKLPPGSPIGCGF